MFDLIKKFLQCVLGTSFILILFFYTTLLMAQDYSSNASENNTLLEEIPFDFNSESSNNNSSNYLEEITPLPNQKKKLKKDKKQPIYLEDVSPAIRQNYLNHSKKIQPRTLEFNKEPTLIFGGGSGFHVFSKTDQTREPPLDFQDDKINSYGYLRYHYYLEWYLWPQIAIGYQKIYFESKIAYSGGWENDIERTWQVHTHLFTVNWFLPRENNWQLNFLAGLGITDLLFYERSESQRIESLNYRRKYLSSGYSALLGTFFDLGNRTAGLRFGVNYFYSQLGSINVKQINSEIDNITPDVSGVLYYIDIRFGF